MEAFSILVIVVTVASAVVSVVFYVRADRVYRQIGRLGELWLDSSENPDERERDASREDLREMVDAVSRARSRADRRRAGRDR